MDAVRQVPLRQRERVTFEYVLLGGVNDSRSMRDEVVKLVRRAQFPAKVNLIAWNPGPGSGVHDAASGGCRAVPGAAAGAGGCRRLFGGRGGGIFMRLAGS